MASSENRTPLLIVCDAGNAGRDLLVRKDFDLAWALSPEEARASAERRRPTAVIVREALAAEVLAQLAPMGLPILVLLEPDGWANREGYLQAGATALVQSSARARILQAVAEMTGRPFPEHARVPFAEFVEVDDGRGVHMVETVDMSNTGMGLRYLPDVEVGNSVRVIMDHLQPPLSLPAVVIRADGDTVGLRFTDLEGELEARVKRLVDTQTARFPAPEMPEGLTVDLGGTLTMELFTVSGTEDGQSDAFFRRMLGRAVHEGAESREGWPRWLVNIEARLTELERKAYPLDPSQSHASAAIDLRIMLARTRAQNPETFPSRPLAQRVLDFSRLLEMHIDGEDSASLSDVTLMRGQLLRAVYGDLGRRDRTAAAAA